MSKKSGNACLCLRQPFLSIWRYSRTKRSSPAGGREWKSIIRSLLQKPCASSKQFSVIPSNASDRSTAAKEKPVCSLLRPALIKSVKFDALAKSTNIEGYAKNAKQKTRDNRAMKSTYVRRSSETITATKPLVSFCNAIKFPTGNRNAHYYVPERIAETVFPRMPQFS